MSIERSLKGRLAKPIFFSQFNDVDIYVEDTNVGARKLYTILFQRALSSHFNVDSVFPLGNKSIVIQQCRADQAVGGRKRLYVVDADLDLLCGVQQISLRRLFVLARYCIENYLIDQAAITKLLNEEDPEKSYLEISTILDYSTWKSQNEMVLIELFKVYAVAHGLRCTANVSLPVSALLSNNSGIVDPKKVHQRIAEIEKVIIQTIGNVDYHNRKAAISARIDKTRLLHFVSAKDYLLPLLLIRARAVTRIRSDNVVIRQRLAMNCDVGELVFAAACIC